MAAALTLLAAGGGCSRGRRAPAPVLLVGIDGLEWNVLLPLLRAGLLPALQGLMQRGSYGLLETSTPTLSPVIWTTIATGRTMDEHGIRGFSKPFRRNQPRALFSNRDRRVKALWNIASDYHKRVAVVGWWMTHPVEPINGVMVAQTNTLEQLRVARGLNIWKGGLVPGDARQVHPSEREAEMLDILAEVEAGLPERLERIFGRFEHPLSLLGERLWTNCRWAFRADATYAAITERLISEGEGYDLLALYLGGPDVVAHRFWRYREPKRFQHAPSAAQVENFGRLIDDYYVYVDGLLGRLLERLGPEANVIVVSDHGMGRINTGARFDPDDPPVDVNSAHHMGAPPGVMIAAGPDIQRALACSRTLDVTRLERADLPTLASIMDLAKTVLALLGLPIAADMHGVPLVNVLTPEFLAQNPLGEVPTHESEAWSAARRELFAAEPESQAERIEQLKALGYIGADGDTSAEQMGGNTRPRTDG